MTGPTFIDLNLVELKCYPFMISLDKCSGSCNPVDDLSAKICVSSKIKDINVKVFNMITNKNEAKAMVKHILCDCKCKFNSKTCNSKQKRKNETGQWECKNYRTCKKDNSWNPGTSVCDNGKYLKSTADDSKVVCDEIIYIMDIVSINMANTMAKYATSTVSINCHNKKVKYKMDYILLEFLGVILVLFKITFICYYYKSR